MHKSHSESNSFAYGNLNSSLFPTSERLLLFTTEGLTAKMSEMCLRECDWVQLYPAPTESTKPTDSSGLSVQREVKGIAVQQGNLPVNLQVISVHTPQYWESPADFSLCQCPGTQDCWVTWNEEQKSSPHIQNILLSTFEWLATPKLFCKVRNAVPRL